MPRYEITWSALHPRAYQQQPVLADAHAWRDRPPALVLLGRPGRPQAVVLRVAGCYLESVRRDGVPVALPRAAAGSAAPQRGPGREHGRRHGGMG